MNIIRDLNLFRVRQNMIENQWDKATRNTNHNLNLFRVRQNMIENQWDKATRNTNHRVLTGLHSRNSL